MAYYNDLREFLNVLEENGKLFSNSQTCAEGDRAYAAIQTSVSRLA